MAIQKEIYPSELFEGLQLNQIAGTLGRWLLLKELSLGFTEKKNLQIARDEMPGYAFWGALHKTWAGIHGNGNGLHLADVEIAADMLGVYDDVFAYRDGAVYGKAA